MRRALSTAALALLAGCGYVGPPQPPALHIPEPVFDLRAVETGDQIVVQFTPPARTTEDLPATQLQAIRLFIGPSAGEFSRDRWAASARRFDIPVDASQFTFDAAEWAGQDILLGLRTTGRSGRQSDWSNLLVLPVIPPLATPAVTSIDSVREGVSIRWSGNAPRYRVQRMAVGSPDAKLEPLAEVDSPNFLDSSTIYGVEYRYALQGFSGNTQSLLSMPAAITPTDKFAPGVPRGLTTIATAQSVDLSWTRNDDDDLASYNIFRAEGDGAFSSLATGVALPAFTDTRVEARRRYRYVVSAVDTVGNESGHSAEQGVVIE